MSVRGSFDNGLYIYDPSKVDGWVTAKSCVWHGPKFLSSVSVLETHYSGDHSLEHFFQKTLDVKDSTIDTVLSELKIMRVTGLSNGHAGVSCRTHQAYTYLDSHSESSESLKQIR
jgi:ethanolamine ammonia-lyase small subunit